MSKQVTCTNGALLEYLNGGPRYNRRNSLWLLVHGDWPSDEELLKIGDGWIPPATHGPYDFAPFGGTVTKTDKPSVRMVSVYTD